MVRSAFATAQSVTQGAASRIINTPAEAPAARAAWSTIGTSSWR